MRRWTGSTQALSTCSVNTMTASTARETWASDLGVCPAFYSAILGRGGNFHTSWASTWCGLWGRRDTCTGPCILYSLTHRGGCNKSNGEIPP